MYTVLAFSAFLCYNIHLLPLVLTSIFSYFFRNCFLSIESSSLFSSPLLFKSITLTNATLLDFCTYTTACCHSYLWILLSFICITSYTFILLLFPLSIFLYLYSHCLILLLLSLLLHLHLHLPLSSSFNYHSYLNSSNHYHLTSQFLSLRTFYSSQFFFLLFFIM